MQLKAKLFLIPFHKKVIRAGDEQGCHKMVRGLLLLCTREKFDQFLISFFLLPCQKQRAAEFLLEKFLF